MMLTVIQLRDIKNAVPRRWLNTIANKQSSINSLFKMGVVHSYKDNTAVLYHLTSKGLEMKNNLRQYFLEDNIDPFVRMFPDSCLRWHILQIMYHTDSLFVRKRLKKYLISKGANIPETRLSTTLKFLQKEGWLLTPERSVYGISKQGKWEYQACQALARSFFKHTSPVVSLQNLPESLSQ